jgi:K+-transporting ATPase ATPase A chain
MAFLTGNGLLQITLYFAALFACVKPLGVYMANVYSSPRAWPLESAIYKLIGINRSHEMHWKEYAVALLSFNGFGLALLYILLRWQSLLPLNPQHLPNLSPDLAFNTAVSFVTNTSWQSYGGETTLSYLSQMAGIAVQSFLSAAVGLSVLAALMRGLTRRNRHSIGNFWVDCVRSNLYILLPLSLVVTMALASQGAPQTFKPSVTAPLVEPIALPEQKDASGNVTQNAQTISEQHIALGPVASQIAIKQLSADGGGFFNANSAHPFENPTPLTNFLEMLAMLLIPAGLCYTFGRMAGDLRQGWALLATMTIIFIPLMLFGLSQEQGGNSRFTALGIDSRVSDTQSGGNMEGKEARFGIVNSALWSAVTTASSDGSVNSMHDSFMPLGGAIPLLLMQFSEVIYGGVGSGLYGMLMYVIVAVFVAGLMVGRTPEYLGKKIQTFEMKMVSVAILVPPLLTLLGTAAGVMTEAGRAGIQNPGAQGFSEILYAFTSAANNNGSAFAGLSANTPFYNVSLALCMLFGRYWVIIPVLAIAGSLAAKNTAPQSAGTLPTHTALFVSFLISIVLLVGVLTYLPSLALGPAVEHFHLLASQ